MERSGSCVTLNVRPRTFPTSGRINFVTTWSRKISGCGHSKKRAARFERQRILERTRKVKPLVQPGKVAGCTTRTLRQRKEQDVSAGTAESYGHHKCPPVSGWTQNVIPPCCRKPTEQRNMTDRQGGNVSARRAPDPERSVAECCLVKAAIKTEQRPLSRQR